MLSPAFQEDKPAEPEPDHQAEPRVYRLHPAGEPDPALRYRFWPAIDKRRHASPHPFLSRATLLASQALAQDRDREFSAAYEKILALPLEQMPSDEVRQFLDRYATPALEQLSEIDRLMDTTYDLQLAERPLHEVVTMLLPEVQESRQLARLLAVRARLAVAEQRWDDAVNDLRVGFRLSEIVSDSAPLLISKLVGFAIAGTVFGVIEEAIQQPNCPNLYWALAAVPTQQLYQIKEAMEFEAGNLARVLPEHESSPSGPVSEEAARAELISLATQLPRLFGEASQDSEQDNITPRLLVGLYVITLAEPARELLTASADPSYSVAELSVSQAVLLATRLRLLRARDDSMKWALLPRDANVSLRDKLGSKDGSLRSVDVVTVLAGMLLPAFESAEVAAGRSMQQHHLWMTLEALRMHAAQSRELPASLEDLQPVPALPDTLAHQPFDYQRTSAMTATLTHAPRWPADRDNVISIELVVEHQQ